MGVLIVRLLFPSVPHGQASSLFATPSFIRRYRCPDLSLQPSLSVAPTTPVSFSSAAPSFVSADLRALLVGKLTNAAQGGDAASTTRPANPLLTLTTKHNLLDVLVDGVAVRALIDTGAHISVMSSNLRRRLRKVLTPPMPRVVRVADGSTPLVAGMCTARVRIADHETAVMFTVLEQCPHDLILGLDFLSEHAALIDCSTGLLRLQFPFSPSVDDPQPRFCSTDHVRLPPKAVTYVSLSPSPPVADGDYVVSPIMDVLLQRNVTLPHTVVTIAENNTCLPFLNFGSSSQVLAKGMALATLCPLQAHDVSTTFNTASPRLNPAMKSSLQADEITAMIAPDLSTADADALRSLLASYKDIFDLGSRPLSTTSAVRHRINTGDATPVHRRPYRVSHAERLVIQREVDKMLSNEIVEPSSSPWASPVVLVKKKDGTWRFCVDYRHLNKITKKDVYPLPRIDDALDCLHGARYFSSIDLRSGYWQIAVDEQDREKTAFVTPDGLYQFRVMPFGLCNAPATFERMMDSLLRGFKWSTCLCYLDDVIVFSPTFETHLERLSDVLAIFRRAGLQLNSKKCRFGRRQITILGHLVDASGVQPDPEKVRAVTNFPEPRSTHDVRSFLGLCSYFRRFIKILPV